MHRGYPPRLWPHGGRRVEVEPAQARLTRGHQAEAWPLAKSTWSYHAEVWPSWRAGKIDAKPPRRGVTLKAGSALTRSTCG